MLAALTTALRLALLLVALAGCAASAGGQQQSALRGGMVATVWLRPSGLPAGTPFHDKAATFWGNQSQFEHYLSVRDRDALEALFADCAPYDILVTAATGGDRAAGPFMEMDMDGYQGSFDKLWGYANVVRFGVGRLSDDGAIVLVSGSPARKAKPGQVALASVGGAVEALVRGVAPEIVPKRLNVVSPGLINTNMFGPASEKRDEMVLANTAENLIPRGGTADEVAQGILFVIQNDFVTGTTVDVDGGWLLANKTNSLCTYI